MDDIHLSGNVWIQCLYAQGKMMSGIPQDVSVRSKGRGSFDTKVYISYIQTEVFNCGLALVRLYMHILYECIDVFTYG